MWMSVCFPSVVCVCVCVCARARVHVFAWYPQKPEEGMRASGSRVTV